MKVRKGIFAVLLMLLTANATAVSIDFTAIGNLGNAAHTNGLGAVNYNYRMGVVEVTNTQYSEFLNAAAALGDPNGLYDIEMGTHFRAGIARTGTGVLLDPYAYTTKQNFSDKPVNLLSWYDAARFVNWLHNGQGSGDTENGAYDLTGGNMPAAREPGARYWLPSENEWFKAARYSLDDGDGDPGYWGFATQSDTQPDQATADAQGNVTNPGANVANYGFSFNWNDGEGFGNVSTVGGTQSSSFYGTFDQNGNVGEWLEDLIGTDRVYIGGGFNTSGANFRQVSEPALQGTSVGFRIAAAVVPIPGALILFLSGFGVLVPLVRRKSKYLA